MMPIRKAQQTSSLDTKYTCTCSSRQGKARQGKANKLTHRHTQVVVVVMKQQVYVLIMVLFVVWKMYRMR